MIDITWLSHVVPNLSDSNEDANSACLDRNTWMRAPKLPDLRLLTENRLSSSSVDSSSPFQSDLYGIFAIETILNQIINILSDSTDLVLGTLTLKERSPFQNGCSGGSGSGETSLSRASFEDSWDRLEVELPITTTTRVRVFRDHTTLALAGYDGDSIIAVVKCWLLNINQCLPAV